jgi:NitT/TauT family transport system ATP-binding protein
MDEPFAALDAITREAMNIELQRIWSYDQKTVLFITHSIPEAVFLADRVVIMTPRPGRIAQILDVPFKRPRSIADLATIEFAKLTAVIRAALHSDASEHGSEAQLQICA